MKLPSGYSISAMRKDEVAKLDEWRRQKAGIPVSPIYP